MTEITLFADGACHVQKRMGGWGAVLECRGGRRELGGHEEDTTNNRMELTAVIEGLEVLKRPCEVSVVSDSKYVVDAFNQAWLETWQGNGWRTSKRKPVENKDLWEKLLSLAGTHKLSFVWTEGHAGHPGNERAHSLASQHRGA